MKPSDGRYQAATQVKELSHEITNIEEVDSFHVLEDRMRHCEKASDALLLRGLRPWHGIEWKLQELGRPGLFSEKRIFADNLKKKGSKDDDSGVGLTHSRGVAGVMPCEKGVHSKGSAVICRGEGKHGLNKETG